MKPLTAAQWHTLALLHDGNTIQEAAHARHVSTRTIGRHRDRAIRNLDAQTLEQALDRFKAIRKHKPPPEPRPVELDTGERYYVTALTGLPTPIVGGKGHQLPKIYHVHDRDYCGRIIASYDEQLKDPASRRERALKTARQLNQREEAETHHAVG